MTKRVFAFSIFPGPYAVVGMAPGSRTPEWAEKGDFVSLTRTPHELSIVCPDEQVPWEIDRETGWRVLQIKGPLDFSLVGVIADIAAVLSGHGIGIFVISTFETDYILIRDQDLDRAAEALRREGHIVETL